VRAVCECDSCGLQLRLFNGDGSSCPRCGGTFYKMQVAKDLPAWSGEPTEFGIERDMDRVMAGLEQMLKAEADMDEHEE
jgi:hypothetical protein